MNAVSRLSFVKAASWNWPAIAFGAGLLALWEISTRGLALPVNIFPPPSFVAWSLFVRTDLFVLHAWLTFSQTILGFLISVGVGIALGWVISKSRLLHETLYPVLVVLQVMPKEALAPLLVLWFGAGTLSRTALAFLIAFFPMVINTIIGVRSLDFEHQELRDIPVLQPMADLFQGGIPLRIDRDFCRHEDFRDPFGDRRSGRRNRRWAQRPRLSAAVRLQPPRHGVLAGDPVRARALGRRIVRRDRLAGAPDDLLALLTRLGISRLGGNEGSVDRDADGAFDRSGGRARARRDRNDAIHFCMQLEIVALPAVRLQVEELVVIV